MIAVLGKFAGYFSGKFLGAKLVTDLYLEKKKNKNKNKNKGILKEGGDNDVIQRMTKKGSGKSLSPLSL